MADDINAYDAVIADMEAKRDQLSVTIEMLKMLRTGGVPPVAVGISSPAAPFRTIDPFATDAFFGMTIPEAARKYLTFSKKTKPHPELCDALIAGGFKTTSPNFREVVRSTLGRNPDFVKVSGEWGLSEWYGGRNKTRSKRAASANSDDSAGDDKGGEGTP